MFYFTTLFSGGLVPYYILMIRYLRLKDSYLALLLPLLFNVFNLIIMKSYMSGIPIAFTEAAIIDGCGDFSIYFKIMLPLSNRFLPRLACLLLSHTGMIGIVRCCILMTSQNTHCNISCMKGLIILKLIKRLLPRAADNLAVLSSCPPRLYGWR